MDQPLTQPATPTTKLVEAKLEMVRAAGLFHCGAAVGRVRWLDTMIVFSAMKSTDVYKEAFAASQSRSRCN